MKKLKIEPKGFKERQNSENGIAGECLQLKNMRERENSLAVCGDWKKLGDMDENGRIMLVDRRETADCYLSCNGSTVYLYAVKSGGVFTTLNAEVCTLDGEVKWLQNVGDFVVAGTTAGLRYLCYVDGTYHLLDFSELAPQLVFSAVNRAEISETVHGETFDTAYSSWSQLTETDRTVLRKSVVTAYASLVENAKQSGAFLQPVAVRYAVRMWDDTYSWVSALVIVGNEVQAGETVSATVDNTLTSYADSVMTGVQYNIGVNMVKRAGEKWSPLIKSVDILVSDEMSPFVDDTILCRCETSSTSQALHYLTYGLCRREPKVAIAELLNPPHWRVIARFPNANDDIKVPENGTTVVLRSGLYSDKVSRESVSQITEFIRREIVANTATNVNGRLYTGGHRSIMRHAWHSAQWWGSGVLAKPCEVIVIARLLTPAGEAVKVAVESLDYTPQKLNALVAYPDSRATALTVKVLSDGNITEWSGTLFGVDEQGYACFVNEDLAENEMSAGYSFYEDTEQNTEIPALNEVVVSRNGNPFVTDQCRNVWQGEVLGLASVVGSVYSSVFGRYPVYAFSTDGIYAVAYKESGDYKDAQLIDRRQLGEARVIATSGDSVYFVSVEDELCRLKGKEVEVIAVVSGVSQLAWVYEFGELLIRHDDNSVSVFMSDGRFHERTQPLQNVYGDYYDAVAQDLNGNLLSLNDETVGVQTVLLETYPIAVQDDEIIAPVAMAVNVEGEFDNCVLELLGSDGAVCDWRVLTAIELNGKCCNPKLTHVFTRPCRLLKLKLYGSASTGALLRDVTVKYV